MKNKKNKFRPIQVLEADYLKIKKLAAVRDIRIYELISLLIK